MIPSNTWLIHKDGRYLTPVDGAAVFTALADVNWMQDGPLAFNDQSDAQRWAQQYGGEVIPSSLIITGE